MMIQIISGGYGHRKKNSTYIQLMDKNSKPFEVDDDEAKRLIALGIAKSIEVIPDQEPVIEKLEPQHIEEMGYNELRQLAKDLDLNASGTKQELIERIVGAQTPANDEEDEEQPPVLEAVDPE